jgi:hypothetical protein
MTKKSLRVFASLVAVAALSACGGSSSDESTSNSDNTGSADDSSEIVKGSDCLTAASAFNAVNQDVMMALGMPQNFNLDKLKDNIEKAKAAVPSEIESEFALFADTYGEVGEILVAIGKAGGLTNPANAAQIAELEEKLDSKEFGAAMDRLQDFFVSECIP